MLYPCVIIFVDIEECTAGGHNCDSNAACTNNAGSFSCACNSGYSGDGTSCAGKHYFKIVGYSGFPAIIFVLLFFKRTALA